MTQDPYQSYPTFGAYTGQTNPFSSPYTAMQTSAINPTVGYNPLAAQTLGGQGIQGIPGVSNYGGVTAQQLQLASALAAQAALQQLLGLSPMTNGWQNPIASFQNAGQIQNPLLQASTQNPFAIAGNPFGQASPQMQNPLLNPILAHFSPWLGQQAAFGPYAQFQQPYQQHHQHQMGYGYGVPGFGPQIPPFGQLNSPTAQFNSPLAPQSWVGQGLAGQGPQIGGGQGYGQVNPLLAQLAARGFQGSPWTGF